MTTIALTDALGYGERLTARVRSAVGREIVVDNFAGAGGASLGIEAALGRCVDIAINHSRRAVEIHSINHPNTRHLCEDVWDVDPLATTGGRPVGLAWFSPDCKHFSKAKGGKPLSKRIRGLAWVVIRWARAVKPRVIILENVEEFQTWGPLDADGKPIKAKAGQTFLRWKGQLRNLGYEVEHRELVAADYGVPTTRKRFFLIARCDGRPIVWPDRTHAPRAKCKALHLKTWRAAAECIDWSMPCPSIFERKRPLAEATMRRIARGLKRYVIDAAEPFIVCCNHSGEGFRGQAATEPLRTVTGSRDAVGVVVPSMINISHYNGRSPANDAQQPMPTLTANPKGGHMALVEAFLTKYHGEKSGDINGRCATPAMPFKTLDTQNRFGLASVCLQRFRFGEKEHVDPRQPMQTICAGGNHHAVLSACLTKMYGTCRDGQSVKKPMPTITGGGQHIAEVRAFLVKYYSCGDGGADVKDPMHTITTKDRLGLVTVSGQDYQIVDIGLRMLDPKELLRAQFGRFAGEYILHGTKADQVAAIGNSVCPELAEVLVKANVVIQGGGK